MHVRKWAIRLLSLRSTFSRFLHLWNEGTEPVRKLLDNLSTTSWVRLANDDGIGPIKPDCDKSRYVKLVRRWNWLGIWLVVKSLSERSSLDKYVNRKRADDSPILPETPSLLRSKLITWPESSHSTSFHWQQSPVSFQFTKLCEMEELNLNSLLSSSNSFFWSLRHWPSTNITKKKKKKKKKRRRRSKETGIAN